MGSGAVSLKQKKRIRKLKNKYLKPGALAQLRNTRSTGKHCKDIGKKRILLDLEKEVLGNVPENEVVTCNITPVVSPSRVEFQPIDGVNLQRPPKTPRTPQMESWNSHSDLESLPLDILVKIICHLHHDQLRAVFHVSQRIRAAVIIARQTYFNYTTPDRSRQEMLMAMTPVPKDHWPFTRNKGIQVPGPATPKAPKHVPRHSRLRVMDVRQIAAVLFQESSLPPMHYVPPGLPKPICKPVASTRVLCEDELCQAVAQNKLL